MQVFELPFLRYNNSCKQAAPGSSKKCQNEVQGISWISCSLASWELEDVYPISVTGSSQLRESGIHLQL